MTAASEWPALADPSKADPNHRNLGEAFRGLVRCKPKRCPQDRRLAGSQAARQRVHRRASKAALKSERHAQDEWLKKRAEEITGPVVSVQSRQGELFGSDGDDGASDAPAAEWVSITDPSERLAAFASDRSQRPSQRSEADGVLRIYQQRTRALEMLMDLRPPEVILLGVLMLVPEVKPWLLTCRTASSWAGPAGAIRPLRAGKGTDQPEAASEEARERR